MNTASHCHSSAELVTLAKAVLPGGTFGNLNSNILIREGRGAHVWDEDGREYIDYLLGSGPMLVGHAHPDVTKAVCEQVPRGTTFFANNRHGVALADEIVRAVPCAEKVRFVSSGSEAGMYAMRLARAFRGRSRLLKFEGGYHGMSDSALMSLYPKGPSALPAAVPDSAGITDAVRSDVLVAPFNDADYAKALILQHCDELAGVIVEPMQRIIAPQSGFLETLREVTRATGIPLIFDEVVTGFRLAYGGAQEKYGVIPDICTLGKVCGGGFPLAAIAGRADIMTHFDRAAGPERFLLQIGTLSGNPVAATAGLATLRILRSSGAYERLYATGNRLMSELRELLTRARLPAQVVGVPPLFDVVFTASPITNYRDVLRGDAWLAQRFNALLLEEGIFKGDSKYYVSLAHSEQDVGATVEAWASALDELTHDDRRRKQ